MSCPNCGFENIWSRPMDIGIVMFTCPNCYHEWHEFEEEVQE